MSDDVEPELELTMMQTMLEMLETEPEKFQTMCKVLGVDPIEFAEFLKNQIH